MTSDEAVGIVGNDVPRQLVLAAGMIPRRLTGSWNGDVGDRAAELLGSVDAVAARILTGILGRTESLSAIIVCNDSQAHLRLFYVLRMLRTEGFPPVHLVDLPRRDSPAARRFATIQLQQLAGFLSEVCGHALDSTGLRTAAHAEIRLADAVARLRQRRRSVPSSVLGGTALRALSAVMSRQVDDAVAIVDSARDEPRPSAQRVHLTGSAHPDASLYDALEMTGMVVVSDDHDTADLAWVGAAVVADGLEEVCAGLAALHFSRDPASAVGLVSERAAASLARAVHARADVAVSLLRPFDDAPLWDAAETRAALATVGIPFVLHSRVDGADASTLAQAIASDINSERERP